MLVSTEQVFSKVLKRLVPFIMLLFFISLLDRANFSYAALQMNKDLGLGPSAYGFAAGIFFIGYFLFESRAISRSPKSAHGNGLAAS